MRIHADQQRPKTLDAEAPQAFGIEVIQVDGLDRVDPGGLEGRRPTDDGEIGAAYVAKASSVAAPCRPCR